MFAACAVLSIISSQTGESAEQYLKNLKAIDEIYLERHVAAADIANYGMITLGALALITLIFKRIRNIKFMRYLILILSLAVFVLMARAGNLGGEIMHKEIRSDQTKAKIQTIQIDNILKSNFETFQLFYVQLHTCSFHN